MNNTPVRLEKKTDYNDKIEAWALSHANIFMPLTLMTLAILIVFLAYAVVGVCAVESGMLRNFLINGV